MTTTSLKHAPNSHLNPQPTNLVNLIPIKRENNIYSPHPRSMPSPLEISQDFFIISVRALRQRPALNSCKRLVYKHSSGKENILIKKR